MWRLRATIPYAPKKGDSSRRPFARCTEAGWSCARFVRRPILYRHKRATPPNPRLGLLEWDPETCSEVFEMGRGCPWRGMWGGAELRVGESPDRLVLNGRVSQSPGEATVSGRGIEAPSPRRSKEESPMTTGSSDVAATFSSLVSGSAYDRPAGCKICLHAGTLSIPSLLRRSAKTCFSASVPTFSVVLFGPGLDPVE